MKRTRYVLILAPVVMLACQQPAPPPPAETPADNRIRVIFDTDANTELDDQHALAYLLFNGETFVVEMIVFV